MSVSTRTQVGLEKNIAIRYQCETCDNLNIAVGRLKKTGTAESPGVVISENTKQEMYDNAISKSIRKLENAEFDMSENIANSMRHDVFVEASCKNCGTLQSWAQSINNVNAAKKYSQYLCWVLVLISAIASVATSIPFSN